MTCAPTLELMNSPTLPLTGGVGGEQPAERERGMTYVCMCVFVCVCVRGGGGGGGGVHLLFVHDIPTWTSSVTSTLLPAQLMAEMLISRGMLYSPH